LKVYCTTYMHPSNPNTLILETKTDIRDNRNRHLKLHKLGS